MTRLVAFLTAARRSRAARENGHGSIAAALPVWHLGSAHLPTVHR